LSGSTFFTLGYGDVIPTSPFARALAVLEAGMGFGFLGTVMDICLRFILRFPGVKLRFLCWTHAQALRPPLPN